MDTCQASVFRPVGLRLLGNLVKGFSYPYHWLWPSKRFPTPPVSPAGAAPVPDDIRIPRIVWQTNFTDRCTLPLWVNHCYNRRMARGFEHRYVSTEAREEYMRTHASPRTFAAFSRLKDGAAQADLWRIQVLLDQGGVYMDIDAALLRPLAGLLRGRDQLFIGNHKGFTNFFMATVPGNPIFRDFLETVVSNIENHSPDAPRKTVFYVTGPGALGGVLEKLGASFEPRNGVCIQGAFANEYFQYMDKPKSKWKYKTVFIDTVERRDEK